jgi:UDP-glucose:(heptosyl)LPS alpha-1,3-glucosyltransferase
MKLAIIRQKYSAFGGAERFIERLLPGLAQHNVDVSLIARKWAGEASSPMHWVLCDPFYIGSAWRDKAFAKAACQKVAAGNFELVQSHERLSCCDIFRAGDGVHAAWLEARQNYLGESLAWLRLNPFHANSLAAERRMFASARLKKVICISDMVRKDVQRIYAVPDKKLVTIYNGIDIDAFCIQNTETRSQMRASLAIPGDALTYVFVGSGFKRKGLETAIRALPESAHLIVVGKDKETARFQKIAAETGANNAQSTRVHFVGPQKDVRPYYAAADAFVFPTIYEPFGSVVLEALACGLPVITTDRCGGGEILTQGGDGFVLPTGDIPAFAACMRQNTVLDWGNRRAAARATAERYPISRTVDAMLALYQEVIHQALVVPQ